jgi:hypothetical protein
MSTSPCCCRRFSARWATPACSTASSIASRRCATSRRSVVALGGAPDEAQFREAQAYFGRLASAHCEVRVVWIDGPRIQDLLARWPSERSPPASRARDSRSGWPWVPVRPRSGQYHRAARLRHRHLQPHHARPADRAGGEPEQRLPVLQGLLRAHLADGAGDEGAGHAALRDALRRYPVAHHVPAEDARSCSVLRVPPRASSTRWPGSSASPPIWRGG